jgi:predicted transcriptional regulator
METTGLYGSALLQSDTSHQAKLAIEPHTGRMETLILEHLQIFGPRTCDELESELEMLHSTTSARLTALRDKGRIIDSGVRHKTRSGRQAVLWRLP